MGNHIKRDQLFEDLEEYDDDVIRFSINDFCFNHYSICTLVRSSLFGEIISKDRMIGSKKTLVKIYGNWKTHFP